MNPLYGDIYGNRLLDALPTDEWRAFAGCLEHVRLQQGQVLSEPGQRVDHVYFPVNAVISLLQTMEDGALLEVAAVGNEGLCGMPALTGSDAMPSRAQVHIGGFAYRASAARLRDRFAASPYLRRLLLLYLQALITQIAQTAACNRRHSLMKQLCRWLLLSIDRLASNELTVTQETIANLLGVRREGVTEAAGRLQQAGLIRHSRGRITVLDRHGLEAGACECYGVVHREFERLLPPPRLSDRLNPTAAGANGYGRITIAASVVARNGRDHVAAVEKGANRSAA